LALEQRFVVKTERPLALEQRFVVKTGRPLALEQRFVVKTDGVGVGAALTDLLVKSKDRRRRKVPWR